MTWGDDSRDWPTEPTDIENDIKEGLRQSAAGEVVDLGSFEKYADEPTDIDALIAEHWGVIASFGDMSPIGNLSRRTIRELESTAAELRQERERAAEEGEKNLRHEARLMEERDSAQADLTRAREVIEKVRELKKRMLLGSEEGYWLELEGILTEFDKQNGADDDE